MPRITKLTWTPKQEVRLIELAEAGASIIRISAAVNKTVAAVRARSKALGIQIRTSREIRSRMRGVESAVSRRTTEGGGSDWLSLKGSE